MMRTLLVSALVLAVTLAGCTGIPDDHVDYGDFVALTLSIERAANTADGAARILLPPVPTTQPVPMLAGERVFFDGTVQAVHGHGEGDEVTFVAPGKGGYQEVRVSALLDPLPRRSQVDQATLAQAIGPTRAADLAVGDKVAYRDMAHFVRSITPAANNSTTIVLEADLNDPFLGGVQDRRDQIGGIILSEVVGDQIVRRVQPHTDAVFLAQGGFLAPPNPLGLEPGIYRQKAVEGDTLVLAKLDLAAGLDLGQLFDRPVLVRVTLGEVFKNTDPYARGDPAETNLGARLSPYT